MNTLSLRAIKRQPAEHLTADELRRLITSGQLLPGTRVTETHLAEQFEVSRGTVRIALHQLSQEGLIVQTPYTGWTVMSISPKDVWELYTLRASLESLAARLASEKLTPAGAEELRKVWEKLEQACNANEKQKVIAERDFQVHQKIVELAGHDRLMDQYRLVEQQVKLFVASTYTESTSPESVIEHHQPIVEAILRKAPQEAARLIEEHNISEGEKLYRHLDAILSPEARKQWPSLP